ncbi:MAG: cation:proton antiporter [Acidobacteriales bacterium]|nr:cation:proton antiporter [Terriglobales bacterium]
MNLTAFFALLGGLLVLAFVANRQFRRTRVSDVVILMAVGLVIGPGFGWVNASEFHGITQAFGTLALILILFAAGLELDVSETARHFWGGLVLGLVAYLLTFGAVTAVFRFGLAFEWTPAMLAGAVLGCTSGSIVIPVLEQMQLREPVKITLLMEASLGDVLAVLTVKVLLDAGAGGGAVMGTLLGGFFVKTFIALLLA